MERNKMFTIWDDGDIYSSVAWFTDDRTLAEDRSSEAESVNHEFFVASIKGDDPEKRHDALKRLMENERGIPAAEWSEDRQGIQVWVFDPGNTREWRDLLD